MHTLRHQARLLVVAIQFLTRLPVPALAGFETAWLAQAARYFPLVGVLVGLANVAVWWLASRVFPAGLSIGLTLAASLLLTGAFHEDGFADTCDGCGGGATPAQVLDIMQDSRIGAYGALGLLMMLGLKWATLDALPAAAFVLLVPGAHGVSRWCATGLIWRLRYVRTGNGKAKPMADRLGTGEWLGSGLLAAGAFGCWCTLVGMPDAVLGRALMAGLGVATVVGLLAAVYFRQRIGGYTGDCLGAVQQLAELGFLLGGLAVCGPV